MSLQDGDARLRRLRERKQLLQEQQAINKQMLAILDEEDQLDGGPPASTQQHHTSQADGIQQQETPVSQRDTIATSATHHPGRRTSEVNTQTLGQQNANDADDVAFTGTSTQTAKRRRKRPSKSRPVLSSDSEDDKPLLKKNRKLHGAKMNTEHEGPTSISPTTTAPSPSPPPPSTAVRKTYARKYPVYHSTPDNKYDMIVTIGEHVVELACCFCGANHYERKRKWKSILGVNGMQKHINTKHKEAESEDKGKRGFDWVTRNCVRKILLKSDLEDVRAGTYYVEEVRASTSKDA